jgi:choline dehydrogenase-like flavoprotein
VGGWHLMGTARMGTDPARSVVNEWGRSHDVKNLFIVDGSVFVTSAGVNPTSTIQALALYVADNMKQTPGQPVRLRSARPCSATTATIA